MDYFSLLILHGNDSADCMDTIVTILRISTQQEQKIYLIPVRSLHLRKRH